MKSILIMTLVWVSACAPKTPETIPAQTTAAQATAAVAAAFTALNARDCEALSRQIGGPLRAAVNTEGCTATLATDPLAETALVRAGAPRRDGRDARTWMVDVVLRHGDRDYATIVRLTEGVDGLRVVSL